MSSVQRTSKARRVSIKFSYIRNNSDLLIEDLDMKWYYSPTKMTNRDLRWRGRRCYTCMKHVQASGVSTLTARKRSSPRTRWSPFYFINVCNSLLWTLLLSFSPFFSFSFFLKSLQLFGEKSSRLFTSFSVSTFFFCVVESINEQQIVLPKQ